jgi:hypothetical protein
VVSDQKNDAAVDSQVSRLKLGNPFLGASSDEGGFDSAGDDEVGDPHSRTDHCSDQRSGVFGVI